MHQLLYRQPFENPVHVPFPTIPELDMTLRAMIQVVLYH